MSDSDNFPIIRGGQGRTDDEVHGAGVVFAIFLGACVWAAVLFWAFA